MSHANETFLSIPNWLWLILWDPLHKNLVERFCVPNHLAIRRQDDERNLIHLVTSPLAHASCDLRLEHPSSPWGQACKMDSQKVVHANKRRGLICHFRQRATPSTHYPSTASPRQQLPLGRNQRAFRKSNFALWSFFKKKSFWKETRGGCKALLTTCMPGFPQKPCLRSESPGCQESDRQVRNNSFSTKRKNLWLRGCQTSGKFQSWCSVSPYFSHKDEVKFQEVDLFGGPSTPF